MLLERRQRRVRGVRIVSRKAAPFGTQIVPMRLLDAREVKLTLDQVLDQDGPIVTSALTEIEQQPFRDVGFVELDSLHLLRHDFTPVPRRRSSSNSPRLRLRPGKRSDIEVVLEIDRLGFDSFWQFDRPAFQAARRATPTHRFSVATLDRRVVGYAVTGFAGVTGYLQRLGVHPDVQGRGIASFLVCEAIEWAVGRGGQSMRVNTQLTNAAALRLYEGLGFTLERERLQVLTWPR